MSKAITVTDASFRADVIESDVPVLVDFWASWCAPCKMLAPLVEELAGEYEGRVKFAKVDIDANPVSPSQFNVLSIPTLLLFAGGEARKRIVGYQPKPRLKAELDAVMESSVSQQSA